MNNQKEALYSLGQEACEKMILECRSEIEILEFALENELKKELKNNLMVSLISEAYSANYNLLSILQWKKFEKHPSVKELTTTLSQIEMLLLTTCLNAKSSINADLVQRGAVSLQKH